MNATNNNDLIDIDAMMDAKFGAVGTAQRNAFRKEAYDYCVGQLISEARRSEKMSLQTLADKVGVTRKYLSDVEHGVVEPGVTLFLRTIDALGLRFDIARPLPAIR